MCGIAGISMRNRQPVPEATLAAISTHLAHRGPDGQGAIIHANAGLAHRRLSIIDVKGGQQPISDAKGKVHIVVNGEIYNYQRLRQQLEGDGIKFKTQSDSEVPLHLYMKYGLDFVRHLDGMYAIAILDQRNGDIILARDPVGIKPLYTCVTSAGIAFASEPAALTKSGWHMASLNTSVLPAFINRQFVSGSETLFQGIRRVLPGEVLRIENGSVAERYVVPLALYPPANMSETIAMESLDALLTEKVQSHLQSEVPYGTFLSGGIDSSAVITRMADIAKNLRTYTIGFSNISKADERHLAENLAKKLGTRHTSVEFSERDFWYYLPTMCRAMDDLAADYAALPTLKLAHCAQTDVKVIMSGEGGDEIFAGYGRYRKRSIFQRLMGRPFRGRGDANRFKFLFRDPQLANHYITEMPDQYYHKQGFTTLQSYQARDIAEWLPNDLLLKLDRCLMAYHIEGRVPLLDREMVSLSFAMPDHLKIRGKRGKWLLKSWLEKRHPELSVWAPKRGFTVPIHEWMDRQREHLAPYLSKHPALESLILPEKLENWLEKPLSAKSAKLLFNFLCLAVWYDIHIDGKTGELPFKAA